MEKSDKNNVSNSVQEVDSRIAAVRDLIFGENIQQYNSEFDDVYSKIESLKEENQKNLAASVTNLENKLADLESLMEHKIQDLNDDFEKRVADLDEERIDRRKIGKALEKIALMLQE